MAAKKKSKKKKQSQYGNNRFRAIARPKNFSQWAVEGRNSVKAVFYYPFNQKELRSALVAIRRKLGTKHVKVLVYPVLYQKPVVLEGKAFEHASHNKHHAGRS